MAGNVTTSTASTATGVGPGRRLDRTQDGTLWSIVATSSGQSDLYYSKDSGATWSSSVVSINGVTGISMFIDLDDNMHWVYTLSGSLYYERLTPNAGRTSYAPGGSVAIENSSYYAYPDVVAFRDPAGGGGWQVTIVSSFVSAPANYAVYHRFPISSSGVKGAISHDALPAFGSYGGTLGGNYAQGANTYPSIDFNHTGDGKTVAGGTPHLYAGWTDGNRQTSFCKAVYSAGSWAWNAERFIDTYQQTDVANSVPSWMQTLFDGTRVIFVGQGFSNESSTNSYYLLIFERDAADTTTTNPLRLPVSSSSGYLASGSATYDSAGNIILFGRDQSGANGTRLLNYRKWTRSTATLGPITTLDTTGNDTPYVSAQRGYTSGINLIYTDGTSSPYDVRFVQVTPTSTSIYTPQVML